MSRRGDWIQVASGAKFWPLDPRPDEVDIRDIAHALANQSRFSGHTKEFLSVGQHSVLVSENCDPADALWGLLHDASEAYLVDLPRPLKALPEFAAYREAEAAVMRCVCDRFGLPVEMPESVRRADETLLATEARDLMAPLHPEWDRWIKDWPTLGATLRPWPPSAARRLFLDRYVDLTGDRSCLG